MANSVDVLVDGKSTYARGQRSWHTYLAILLFLAAAIHLLSILSPPSLMDDVDAEQAQNARNMLTSGDWVTSHLDGVIYLEKAPLIYWMMAGSYKVFGPYDWAARIPIALSSIALVWLTAVFGKWAFGKLAGFYAGMCVATCIGLFLFTRILIPDVMLTFTIALAMWAFLRVLDDDEPHPRAWAYLLAASLGVGLLLKSLVGAGFSHRRGGRLPLLYSSAFLGEDLEAISSGCRRSHHPADRRSMAHSGGNSRTRLISFSPCTASKASITAFSGSISSTNNCCDF